MSASDLLICTACGTQFPTNNTEAQQTCRICLDPRQFVPASGQRFITLSGMISSSNDGPAYHNIFTPFSQDERFISIVTQPKFAIGQRAILIQTPAGNILWDCITLLDEATIEQIRGLGGLSAIVISHPHYYTTHLLWAQTFGCPVYIAAADEEWLSMRDDSVQRLICKGPDETECDIKIDNVASGVRAYRVGGHFEGSLVSLYDGRLMIADTLVTTPAGLGDYRLRHGENATSEAVLPAERVPPTDDMASFAFMYSIPNMMPLDPDTIAKMWNVLETAQFTATHGAFMGLDIENPDVKGRVLKSMQLQVKFMGYPKHALIAKTWAR